MTTVKVTTLDVLTVVKSLAAGRSPQFVSDATGLSSEVVRQVSQKHGYPDKDKLSWAADLLQKQLDDQAKAAIPNGTSRPRIAPVAVAGSGTPTFTPTPTVPLATADLLARAEKSPKARTRNLGKRINDQLATLRELVDADDEARQAKQREAAAKAKARAEVKRLEAELAAAKARLNGKPAPTATPAAKPATTAGDHDPKIVRAWARDNRIPCPEKGRVPRAVVDAWRTDQEAGAA